MTVELPQELEIFEGAEIMLRSNVDVPKWFGNSGFITEIIWPNYRRDQMYDTDIPTVHVTLEGMVFIQFRQK